MSLKVPTFKIGCPQPQTVDKFFVFIPRILTSPLRVSETSLPFESRNQYTVSLGGQPIILPGKTRSRNEWSCSVIESAGLDVLSQINALKDYQFEYKNSLLKEYDLSESLNSFKFINPQIFLTDQLTGDLPIYSTILKNAWIKSIDDLGLDWSKPDTPLKWRLTFVYQSISHGFTGKK